METGKAVIQGFNASGLSERDKEALKSETWQKVRKAMEESVRHFTDEHPESGEYGQEWGQVVEEYLKTCYKDGQKRHEVTALGRSYKILVRDLVTVFYDADGNTLFDVENVRLDKEHRQMADMLDKETESSHPVTPIGKTIASIERQALDVAVSGNASEKSSGGNAGSISALVSEGNTKEIKALAKKKLEGELKKAKDKTFAEPVIGYLLKRCEEDAGLSEDVLQEHKAWEKCFDYIFSKAMKSAIKGAKSTAVRDDVVYEWAEDYYHRDDKAEEEKKAKKEAEEKARREKAAADQKAANKDTIKKAEPPQEKQTKEKLKTLSKTQKNGKEMEGQLDMFSLMGM